MAIIYETKEDFERDKLKDQVKDMNLKAETQSGWGLSFLVGGLLIDSFNKKRSNAWAIASFTTSVIGLVEMVKSFITSHKAHDLKLEHERMGPAVEVIPAGASIPAVMDDCPVCKHTANIQPTTLLEQAQRPDFTIAKG